MSWTIYCHMHTESQRRYVGLTKQTMERRWAEHVSKAKSAKGGRWHFPNAIQKYGPDAFSHFVLEVCETLEEANAAEQRWIAHFKSRDPLFGFNLSEGGGSQSHPIRKNPWNDSRYRAKQLARPSSLQTPESRAKNKKALNTPESKAKRSQASKEIRSRPEVQRRMEEAARQFSTEYRPTPETRAKLSAANKARVVKPETREKLRVAILNRTPEVKAKAVKRGRVHSAETRAKIAAALRGRPLSAEHKAKLSEAARRK